jgi:exodeoxyribonuclease-5
MSSINLTQGQQRGLAMARKLTSYAHAPYIAVLGGYAGTGKTTLLKIIAEAMEGYPMIVAPTGKAALRVKEATGIGAKTIHSWMYSPEEDEATGDVSYTLKPPADIDVGELDLLIIDEATMVGPDLWADIYEVCKMKRLNILIVGDPFQLPPVQKDRDPDARPFNLLDPHNTHQGIPTNHEYVMLTEIVRQALDNPIIRASMLVREGNPAEAVFQLPRIPSRDLIARGAETLLRQGVIICHKNETRNRLNSKMRIAMGRPVDRIVTGEPLLVLQNNYRLNRFNGELATFDSWYDEPGGLHKVHDRYRKADGNSRFGIAKLDPTEYDPFAKAILCEEQVFGRFGHIGEYSVTKAAYAIYGKPILEEPEHPETPEEREKRLGYPMLHANFGYVMTCHKSQGSEWGDVLVVIEPSLPLRREDGQRWLYTAVTRAKSSVTLCLGAGAA